MQHMPDKDFDKLFKDSFMDAEIEPSADLWGNIAEQLEPKKKRSFPIMWMAAASVVVVASIMLFTQNGEKVYLQSSEVATAAVKPVEEVQTVPVITKEEVTAVNEKVSSLPTKPAHRKINSFTPKVVRTQIDDAQKNIITSVQPSTQVAHLPIKKSEAKPLDVIPVEEMSTASNSGAVIASLPKSTTTDFVVEEDTNSNKKGIRNMGDLINYVVDRVDKRDKKIIKFDTDDDDNSSIIGLNIGFLKLNKKK